MTERTGFQVHLENFSGPFDLLLTLISRQRLDVTEVALARVTDEFIDHIRALEADWPLDEASEFLVVAATLLDLKAARLLPRGEVDDEEDLAALEARDLLFARLLQYRAFKEVASWLAERLAAEQRRYPRAVGLEDRYLGLLPEVVLGLGPAAFAELAARAISKPPAPTVSTEHLHAPRVHLATEQAIVVERLRRAGSLSFRALAAGAAATAVLVARFLVLLELYREGRVAFEQVAALGELTVRWTEPTGEGR